MAQQTTLIPLAARTSTLIVDSDLDLGAFELIADKVSADAGNISQFETAQLQIPGGRIRPGNTLVAQPTGYDPVVMGFQTPQKIAEWSLPTLYGNDNEFDLYCTITGYEVASGLPQSAHVSWEIRVDDVVVKSGASGSAALSSIPIDVHIDNVESTTLISITATSTYSSAGWDYRTVDASNIRVVGTLEAFWMIHGVLPVLE